jgi:hypothetical protein
VYYLKKIRVRLPDQFLKPKVSNIKIERENFKHKQDQQGRILVEFGKGGK